MLEVLLDTGEWCPARISATRNKAAKYEVDNTPTRNPPTPDPQPQSLYWMSAPRSKAA